MQGEAKTADFQKEMMKLTHKTNCRGQGGGGGRRRRERKKVRELRGGGGRDRHTQRKKASLVSNHFAVPGSTRTSALTAVSALY